MFHFLPPPDDRVRALRGVGARHVRRPHQGALPDPVMSARQRGVRLSAVRRQQDG